MTLTPGLRERYERVNAALYVPRWMRAAISFLTIFTALVLAEGVHDSLAVQVIFVGVFVGAGTLLLFYTLNSVAQYEPPRSAR